MTVHASHCLPVIQSVILAPGQANCCTRLSTGPISGLFTPRNLTLTASVCISQQRCLLQHSISLLPPYMHARCNQHLVTYKRHVRADLQAYMLSCSAGARGGQQCGWQGEWPPRRTRDMGDSGAASEAAVWRLTATLLQGRDYCGHEALPLCGTRCCGVWEEGTLRCTKV